MVKLYSLGGGLPERCKAEPIILVILTTPMVFLMTRGQMIKIIQKNLLLIIIIVFSLFFRLLWLDRFPIGITHDELNYIIAAKSIFWTGGFAPGTAPAIFPTNMANFDITIAEIPVLILSPLIGFFSFSLFTSRVVGAIFSVFSVLAVYLIAKHLTNNWRLAMVSSLIMAINPWSILLGRTIFETNFFVAFFLWGFVVLLKNRGWKIFYALPLYLVGFFSYTGGQVTFYLFTTLTLFYHFVSFSHKDQIKKYLLFMGVVTIVLIGYFGLVLRNQSFVSRGSELYLPSNPKITETVNSERRMAIQNSVNNFFINKATIYLTGFLDKYLNAFSVESLFIKGESRVAFSLQKHGTFYFVDFLFILFGLSYLYKINRRSWFLVIGAIGISAITSALSIVEYSYSQRSGLMYPFIIILVGAGIIGAVDLAKTKVAKYLLATGIILVYFFLFLNLSHYYFFRFPVYASDGWFFQDRLLSRYLRLVEKQYPDAKIIVSTPEPKIIYEEYLFFTNKYDGKEIALINNNLSNRNYFMGNVTFINYCLDKKPKENEIWIYDDALGCEKNGRIGETLRITRLRDVHENYLIKQDKICQGQKLGVYIPLTALKDLKIEEQEVDQFCQNWITKL